MVNADPASLIEVKATVLKPAVLGVTTPNNEARILSPTGIPKREAFRSKIKNKTVDTTINAVVATITILV
jgi:hypothetical protein